jgi:hypothetical protein
MWAGITNTLKTAMSFLQTGIAPPGAPFHLQEQLKKTNHLASRKFFIVSSSFLGLCFFYFASVGILFLLPSSTDMITGYVTIFTKTIEVLAIIIAAYLGVQAVVDLKYNSGSNVSYEAIKSTEQIDEKIITEQTIKYAEIYKNDASYAPIEWIQLDDN